MLVATAPATSANLGPGFDVLALALESPADRVQIKETAGKRIIIRVSGREASTIPTPLRRNSAGLTAQAILKHHKISAGLLIFIDKGVPPGIGLGSSAASAAATAVALNQLFNLKLSSSQLIAYAAQGERASAGVAHADNCAAAILGGLAIVQSYRPLEALSLTPPKTLGLCIATPKLPTPPRKTGVARAILPQQVPLSKLVSNTGNLAALITGFMSGDLSRLGSALQDSIVEPVRATLIPGYQYVRKNALRFGAKGVAISGAGPSMIAFIDKAQTDPVTICEAMREGFRHAGVEATAFSTNPGGGAKVIAE